MSLKGKGAKFRDWEAVDAHFRNSSGAMKVKRQDEDRRATREFRKNWREFAKNDLEEDDFSDLEVEPPSEQESDES